MCALSALDGTYFRFILRLFLILSLTPPLFISCTVTVSCVFVPVLSDLAMTRTCCVSLYLSLSSLLYPSRCCFHPKFSLEPFLLGDIPRPAEHCVGLHHIFLRKSIEIPCFLVSLVLAQDFEWCNSILADWCAPYCPISTMRSSMVPICSRPTSWETAYSLCSLIDNWWLEGIGEYNSSFFYHSLYRDMPNANASVTHTSILLPSVSNCGQPRWGRALPPNPSRLHAIGKITILRIVQTNPEIITIQAIGIRTRHNKNTGPARSRSVHVYLDPQDLIKHHNHGSHETSCRSRTDLKEAQLEYPSFNVQWAFLRADPTSLEDIFFPAHYWI